MRQQRGVRRPLSVMGLLLLLLVVLEAMGSSHVRRIGPTLTTTTQQQQHEQGIRSGSGEGEGKFYEVLVVPHSHCDAGYKKVKKDESIGRIDGRE